MWPNNPLHPDPSVQSGKTEGCPFPQPVFTVRIFKLLPFLSSVSSHLLITLFYVLD